MKNLFLVIFAILTSVIIFLIREVYYLDSKENFTDISNFVNKIKKEVEDMTDELGNFEKHFENLTGELKDMDKNMIDFFDDIENFGETLANKFSKVVIKFFEQMANKIFDPKIFVKIMKTIGSIIYKVMKKTYNLAYKANPDFKYLIWGGVLILLSPLFSLITTPMTVMSLFMPGAVVMVVFLLIAFLIYMNVWKIWVFIFNFIFNIFMDVDWDDILKDLAGEIADIFKDLISKIIKL